MKKIVSVLFTFVFIFCLAGINKAQPNPPKNLTAVEGSWQNYTFVRLNWQADPKGPMRDIYFNIYRKDGAISDSGSFKKLYSRIPMNTWIDRFVQKGQTYSYYVTAEDRSGESGPSDTVEISLDTAIVKATVSGILTDQNTGQPIIYGKIRFIPVFGWGMTNVFTDSTGEFTAHLFPGTYLIYSTAPGYFPEYYDNVRDIFRAEKVTLKSGDSLSVNIALTQKAPPQRFMLSGSVKDSLGNPLKAEISVYNVASNTFHRRIFRAVTDSSGNYTVNVGQSDTVVVFAHPFNKDYLSEFYNDKTNFLDADRIPIDSNVSNINFVLEHKPVYNNGISGTVTGDSGEGVSSIIFAIRLGNKIRFNHGRISTLTDSLGSYQFTNLYPGYYILLAIPQDDYLPTFFRYDSTQTLRWKNADSVMVDSNGMVTGINFTVKAIPDSGANTVNGRVVDNAGNPVAGTMVLATDQNQEVYSYGITNANGNYTISGLIPGSYSITPEKYDYNSTQSSDVTVDYNTAYSATASFSITPESVTSVKQSSNTVTNFVLNQNYPNPFNPTTVISYSIPNETRVTLRVYNILGKEVATLVNGEKPAGNYNIIFNGSNLASGVYFYQLTAGNFMATKKLMLIK